METTATLVDKISGVGIYASAANWAVSADNADTLGGQPPEYYCASAEVADEFADMQADIDYISGAIDDIPAQVQSDWEQSNSAEPDYIKNKPDNLEMSAGTGIGITEANNTLTFSVTANYASATDLTGKIDKVTSATSGTVAVFGSNGVLEGSTFTAEKLAHLYLKAGSSETAKNYQSINRSTYEITIGTQDDSLGITTLDFTAGLLSAGERNTIALAKDSIPSSADMNNPLVTTTDLATAIANFGGFKVVSADQQGYPSVASADTRTVYLVKDTTVTGSDQYKEWIWKEATDPQDPTTSAWDLIGDTSMDLNGYVQFPNSYTAGNLVQFGANDTIVDTSSTISDLTNVQSDWAQTASSADDFIKNKPTQMELTGGTYIDITTASNTVTIDANLSGISGALSDYANVQANWNESDSTSYAYIANKPEVLIPQSGAGISAAPKYLMVVTAMPAAAAIDPNTIYLVQGTYIGT